MGDLKEIRDLFSHDTAEWKPIRDEGTTDMQYAAGDPWEPADREARRKAGRPCVTVDELSQYVNQVVNEVRANKRAVKFTPVGNGADDKSAQFYADKMREIEYRSRAQIAYTTAFENTVCRSFGFVRVNTRYPHSRAVNQDLWIDPVPNPNLITPDSQALMPDLSDMGHCWVRESWDREEFNAKWPGQRIDRFTSDLGKLAGDWVNEKRVFVGEFWKIKTKARTLLVLAVPGQADPVGIFEDELNGAPLPPSVTVLKSRKVDDPSVVQQLTNGIEILEENPWSGKHIPIIGCLGKVLYVAESGSEKRKILSMIRLARDPQMMLAYLATAEAETIGSLTKFPYFAMRGSLTQESLDAIARSLHEAVAVVQVEPYIEGTPPGTEVPFPQRNPWSLDLSSLEMAKESVRRAIQASMGQTPLPTAAQRRNEKSGVALKHIEEVGQKGSFHFTDHYLDMITHVGIVCEDLIDKIYDSPRDVGIRKDDDTAETVRINDPRDPESVSTKGDHLVTVSTGPSFDSEREVANEFAGDLLESNLLALLGPEKAPKIVAKAIKLKNLGPIGDQLADIIAPEPPKDGEPPSVEQLQQQLEQAHGQMQAMGQQLQQATQIIETDQVKQRAQVDKATIDAASAEKLQQMKDATSIKVAMINALTKGVQIDEQADTEALALALEQQHDAAMTDANQQHDRAMAAQQHAQTLEQGQQGHAQAIEQGAMGHQQALEQQAAQPAGAGA